MKCLGVRCGSSEFAYAVLSGTSSSPVVEFSNQLHFPKTFRRPESLKWFYQEIEEILQRHSIKTIVLKGAEPMATRNSSFVTRVEYEAIVFLVASNFEEISVVRKVKVTIAKDLGLKGKARYLASKLDLSVIPSFFESSEMIQDAILAAWSALR